MNPAFNDPPDLPQIPNDDDAARDEFRLNPLEDPRERKYRVAVSATDVLSRASSYEYAKIARVMMQVAPHAPMIWPQSFVDEETRRTTYGLLAKIGFKGEFQNWTSAQKEAIEILARG